MPQSNTLAWIVFVCLFYLFFSFVVLSFSSAGCSYCSFSINKRGERSHSNASWGQVMSFTRKVTYNIYFLTCALTEGGIECWNIKWLKGFIYASSSTLTISINFDLNKIWIKLKKQPTPRKVKPIIWFMRPHGINSYKLPEEFGCSAVQN